MAQLCFMVGLTFQKARFLTLKSSVCASAGRDLTDTDSVPRSCVLYRPWGARLE
jgi:hypothetical protein